MQKIVYDIISFVSKRMQTHTHALMLDMYRASPSDTHFSVNSDYLWAMELLLKDWSRAARSE